MVEALQIIRKSERAEKLFDAFTLNGKLPEKITLWNNEGGKYIDIVFKSGCSFVFPYDQPSVPTFDDEIFLASEREGMIKKAESFRADVERILTKSIGIVSLQRAGQRSQEIQVVADFRSKYQDLKLVASFPLEAKRRLALNVKHGKIAIRMEMGKSSFGVAINEGALMQFSYGEIMAENKVAPEGMAKFLDEVIKGLDSIGGPLLSEAATIITENKTKLLAEYKDILNAISEVTQIGQQRAR